MMDDLLIVGGLVPSLIIDQAHLSDEGDPHVGTMDLDVGLQVALLNEGRYHQLTERLRDAGFEMDRNAAGNPTRQRWAIANAKRVTIDFLIQPTLDGDTGGKLRDLEPDFAGNRSGGHFAKCPRVFGSESSSAPWELPAGMGWQRGAHRERRLGW